MKRNTTLLMIASASTAVCALAGGVPLRWTVETSRVQPAQFEAYHGETLDLEATLKSYGGPFNVGFKALALYWQTNGMGSAYWQAPATSDGNIVRAKFTPEMDTGANLIQGFIGSPGDNFRASFMLRLRPAPGATPNILDLPKDVIDFSVVDVMNAPWATTQYVEEMIDNAKKPSPYVISETANYHYSGDSGIPAGNYYKATTGDGYVRYAAKVPMPNGKIVMSGEDDDPILQYFGSIFRISAIATKASSLAGFVDDGKYSVADLTFEPDLLLGIAATFHVNILNPYPELTGISINPGNYGIRFTSEDGVEHSISYITQNSDLEFSYFDDRYDPNAGWWSSTEYTISVAFNREGEQDYGFAVFGGSPIATLDEIDIARSKLIERTGKADELGSGWGYKVYDFTSDERSWILKTPRLNVSLQGTWDTRFYRRTKQFDDQTPRPSDCTSDSAFFAEPYNIRNGIPLPNYQIRKDVVSTREKYGSDACRYVDYRIGIMAADTNRTESTANGRYAIELNATDIGIGLSNRRYLWGDVTPAAPSAHDYSFTLSTNYVYKTNSTGEIPFHVDITFRDFNITTITQESYTVTVTIAYKAEYISDVFYESTDGCFKKIQGAHQTGTFDASFNAYLATTGGLEENKIHANRVITDLNQHLIWDPGMKCTWQLGVTNGMFYTEKISNHDYRREEYIK